MAEYKNYFKGKTVLITGGAGAIGCNLTEAIAKLDAKAVIVFDDLSSAKRWSVPSLPNVLFVEGSILDEVKLKRVFFEKQFVDCSYLHYLRSVLNFISMPKMVMTPMQGQKRLPGRL